MLLLSEFVTTPLTMSTAAGSAASPCGSPPPTVTRTVIIPFVVVTLMLPIASLPTCDVHPAGGLKSKGRAGVAELSSCAAALAHAIPHTQATANIKPSNRDISALLSLTAQAAAYALSTERRLSSCLALSPPMPSGGALSRLLSYLFRCSP